MGNLRSKYTNEEWGLIQAKVESDRKNGKPNESLLYLSVWDKDVKELKRLRSILSAFYDKYDLSVLDGWINWKGR